MKKLIISLLVILAISLISFISIKKWDDHQLSQCKIQNATNIMSSRIGNMTAEEILAEIERTGRAPTIDYERNECSSYIENYTSKIFSIFNEKPIKTVTLNGSIAIQSNQLMGNACTEGRFRDIRQGTLVRIKSTGGETLNVTELSSGERTSGAYSSCIYSFSIEVPDDGKNYILEVGNRGEHLVTPNNINNRVDLTLR